MMSNDIIEVIFTISTTGDLLIVYQKRTLYINYITTITFTLQVTIAYILLHHEMSETLSYPLGVTILANIFASAFSGALLRGRDEFESARIAAEFTLRCIENTAGDENHKYGAKFETAIPYLIELLNK